MKNAQTKYQEDACPRCGSSFICKANNIGGCDCMQILISREEQDYIAAKFLNCVCNQCLKELKYEHYLIQHHNKPIDYDR